MSKIHENWDMIKRIWNINYVRLFAEISESLLKEKNFDRAVNKVIKSLGNFFEVDRVYLFVTRKEDDATYVDYTNEWCSEGTDSFLGAPELTNVSFDLLPDIMETMLKKKVMYGNVNDHSSEAFKELMNAQNIISYLFSPIVFEDNLFGFVGFDSCKIERTWSQTEANYLSSLGSLVAHRFLRDRERSILESKLRSEADLNRLLTNIDQVKSLIIENRTEKEIYRQLTIAAQNYLQTDVIIIAETKQIDNGSTSYTVKGSGFKSRTLNFSNIQFKGKGIELVNKNTFTIHKGEVNFVSEKNPQYLESIFLLNKKLHISELREVQLYQGGYPIGYLILGNQQKKISALEDLKVLNIKSSCENISSLIATRRSKNSFEQQIMDSESKFRILSEYSNDIIALHSIDTNFKYLSPSFDKILGYNAIDYINKSPLSLMASKTAAREIKNYINSADLTKEIPRTTLKFRARNNEIKYLQTSFSPIFKNGKISEFISTSRDITNEIIGQKALKQSERKFRLISSNQSEIIALHDKDKKFIWASPSIEKILGYTPEEVIGLNPLEAWETSDFKIIKTNPETNVNIVEVQHKSKSGSTVVLEIITSPFQDDELRIDGMLAISRDVTERKEYENKLEIQRRSFERLFEETLSGYIEIFPIDQTVYLSPKFLSILGYVDELDHNALLQKVMHPEDYAKLFNIINLQKESQNTSPIVLEIRYMHKNGTEINMMFAGQVLERGRNQKPSRIIGCNIDLTYVKSIENQLFKSNTALELVLKKTKQVVWIRNLNTNEIEYVSESAKEIFEIDQEELLSGEKFYFKNLYKQDIRNVKKAFNTKDYKNLGIVDIEYRIYDKYKNLIWLRTRGFNIYKDEIPVYRIGITEEITSKKELELNLAQNLKDERSLTEHKSHFISMVSHQFRTPLAIIQTNAELIDYVGEKISNDLNQYLEKYTNRIKSEVNRLTEILEDILIIEKSNKKKLGQRKTQFSIVHILESIIQDYNSNPQSKPLTFKSELTEQVNLIGDETYFRHAVINLIDNALRYTPKNRKGPEISICKSLGYTNINIKDFGIGIPKDEIKSLFKPFFRGTNVVNIKGTGLGLPIAKEFIELLGGKISIDSEIDEGTTITCQFKCN